MKDSKKEILIIDDSATNVFLIESVLNEYGYKAITASNVKDAFKLIEKKHPDLILLDILMPQISGFDFLKTIKQNSKQLHIPIIAVSAVTDEDSISEILNLGADLFITKPIVISDLLEKINGIFTLAQ